MKNCYCQSDEYGIVNVCDHCNSGENDSQNSYIAERLTDYEKRGYKIIDKYDDRNSPTQGGYNTAVIELQDGTRVEVVYMYEDRLWMA